MPPPARYERITSDDQLWRLRRVWIGVGSWTWPMEARYSAWGLWASLTVTFIFLAYATVGLDSLVKLFAVVMYAPAIAVVITWGLFTVVDYERPVRTVLTYLFRAATRLPQRPAPAPRPATLTVRAWARQSRPPDKRWRDRLPRWRQRSGPRRRADRPARQPNEGRRRSRAGGRALSVAVATGRGAASLLYVIFVVQPKVGVVVTLAAVTYFWNPWGHRA